MKFFGYILRNARRNPIRSLLTIASLSVCLALTMLLLAFQMLNNEIASSLPIYNRIIVMGASGFSQPVPIARVAEVERMKGITAVSPFSWYGGKLGEEVVPFAQFGVDPEKIFKIMTEL